jgi:hypothetical protein
MDRVNLAILGAGNVRCSPPVLATLASYFGERPLDIALYDADEERLDLFDRVGRTFFAVTKTPNTLASTTDPAEALAEAALVIVQTDAHCLSRAIGQKPDSTAPGVVERAFKRILANLSPLAEVLSLLPAEVKLPVGRYRHIEWPDELTEPERVAAPHQALRWIHGEEYPFEYFATREDSPLKLWLDNPKTATLVRR